MTRRSCFNVPARPMVLMAASIRFVRLVIKEFDALVIEHGDAEQSGAIPQQPISLVGGGLNHQRGPAPRAVSSERLGDDPLGGLGRGEPYATALTVAIGNPAEHRPAKARVTGEDAGAEAAEPSRGHNF